MSDEPKTRKVKFIAEPGPFSGGQDQFEVGKEYDLPEDQADRWVTRAVAQYVDDPQALGTNARTNPHPEGNQTIITHDNGTMEFPPGGPPGSQNQFVSPNPPYQPMPGTQQPAELVAGQPTGDQQKPGDEPQVDQEQPEGARLDQPPRDVSNEQGETAADMNRAADPDAEPKHAAPQEDTDHPGSKDPEHPGLPR